MLTQFSAVFAECGINIAHMTNKSKKDFAYTIMDVNGEIADLENKIAALDDVMKVRVIA